jgi:hypothetical protein
MRATAPVILAGQLIVGAVISCSITVCVAVDILPLPSLNVQVITVVPCAVIGNMVVVVPITAPTQLSCAIGAVGDAEHSPVIVGKDGGTGAVTSSIITVCLAIARLPWPSLNIQYIV